MSDRPAPLDSPPPERRGGSGIVRVLLVGFAGAALMGFAAFAVSAAVPPEQTIVRTACADASCNYALSAGGTAAERPAPQVVRHSGSAPQRFVRAVLHICHIR